MRVFSFSFLLFLLLLAQPSFAKGFPAQGRNLSLNNQGIRASIDLGQRHYHGTVVDLATFRLKNEVYDEPALLKSIDVDIPAEIADRMINTKIIKTCRGICPGNREAIPFTRKRINNGYKFTFNEPILLDQGLQVNLKLSCHLKRDRKASYEADTYDLNLKLRQGSFNNGNRFMFYTSLQSPTIPSSATIAFTIESLTVDFLTTKRDFTITSRKNIVFNSEQITHDVVNLELQHRGKNNFNFKSISFKAIQDFPWQESDIKLYLNDTEKPLEVISLGGDIFKLNLLEPVSFEKNSKLDLKLSIDVHSDSDNVVFDQELIDLEFRDSSQNLLAVGFRESFLKVANRANFFNIVEANPYHKERFYFKYFYKNENTIDYPENERVLVVYNSKWTGDENEDGVQDSQELANYYKNLRNIPSENIIGIRTITVDTLRKSQYDNSQGKLGNDNIDFIKQKLEHYLENTVDSRGTKLKNKIYYIVLIKGMPLRVSYPRLSLDQLLNKLFQKSSPYEAANYNKNPFHKKGLITINGPDEIDTRVFDNFRSFENYDFSSETQYAYLTSRIDAYSFSEAKEILDRAAFAPAYSASSNTRNTWILDDDPDKSHYAEMPLAKKALEAIGERVVYSNTDDHIRENDGPVIGYCSHGRWGHLPYRYILNYLNFDYIPGAIFTTYESFNAKSFDPNYTDDGQGKLGQFFRMGGTAAVGHSDEPTTAAASDESTYFTAYKLGFSHVEAAYMSLPRSKVNVVAGDPLLRLYQAELPNPAKDLSHMVQASNLFLTWQAPDLNSGPPVLSYIVKVYKANELVLEEELEFHKRKQVRVENYEAGKTYRLEVIAKNSIGESLVANYRVKP